MTAAAVDSAPRIVVSKFSSLFATDVVEVIETSVDAWLRHLLIEPAEEWTGEGYGGWSPVRFSPAKRSRANVQEVYALVLDYDHGATWDQIRDGWSRWAGVIYTTKSHGRDGAERMRVFLPLSRSVSAREYDALWRWAQRQSPVAPDGNAKDPSRFWYAPTLPPGGWRAELLGAELLDPSVASRPQLVAAPAPAPAPVLAQDVERRTRRARAWLERVPGAVSGQSGHVATFSAVASVMIGFDLPDDIARTLIDEWNQRCSPPWSERELNHKFASVAERCTRERGYLLVERPRVDAAGMPEPEAPATDEPERAWTSYLIAKPDGSCRKGVVNVDAFVRYHPDYRGRWSCNEMDGVAYLDGAMVDDEVLHRIRAAAERALGFNPSREDVASSVLSASRERMFHPVRTYLRSVEWDGTSRLREMARDYLGSEDPRHGELVYRWMIGAVARVMTPGCKMDTSLMLVGAQGVGKSTFFAVLGGKYHRDTFLDITNKDALVQLHGAHLYELSELETVVGTRAESRFKAFITSTHDSYRPPYGRVIETRARSVVLCGSTNRREFLTDDTGSRRFWVVPVNRPVDVATLRECRDQLWAEAVACFDAGERWWLTAEADAEVHETNREFQETDPWSEPLASYLANPALTEVTTAEVLLHALGVDIARQGRSEQMRVGRLLGQLGWNRVQVREAGGRRRWVYRR